MGVANRSEVAKPDAGSEAMSESSCRAPRGGWGRRVPKDQLGTQEIRRGG